MDILFPPRYPLKTMRASSFAFVSCLMGLVVLGAGCGSASDSPTPTASSTVLSLTPTSTAMSPTLRFPGVRPVAELQKKVRIKTTMGDIVVQMDPEAGPNAVSNFVYLVEQNFYQGIIFHRVISGFMIQGGDPTGTGMSGPGYTIPDDVVKNMPTRDYPIGGRTDRMTYYPKGTVAMARTSAPNSGGSQFFIMVDDYPFNPATYAVLGRVISGQDVADAISNVERDDSDRPLQDVKMTSVTIEP